MEEEFLAILEERKKQDLDKFVCACVCGESKSVTHKGLTSKLYKELT